VCFLENKDAYLYECGEGAPVTISDPDHKLNGKTGVIEQGEESRDDYVGVRLDDGTFISFRAGKWIGFLLVDTSKESEHVQPLSFVIEGLLDGKPYQCFDGAEVVVQDNSTLNGKESKISVVGVGWKAGELLVYFNPNCYVNPQKLRVKTEKEPDWVDPLDNPEAKPYAPLEQFATRTFKTAPPGCFTEARAARDKADEREERWARKLKKDKEREHKERQLAEQQERRERVRNSWGRFLQHNSHGSYIRRRRRLSAKKQN